jgi:hypothetical protein
LMKPIYVGIPEKKIERKESNEQPALPKNKAKGIFQRIAYIVVEDIRYFFGRKDTREKIEQDGINRMKYEAFMEMCKK